MQQFSPSDPAQDRLKLARQQLRMQAGHIRALARDSGDGEMRAAMLASIAVRGVR